MTEYNHCPRSIQMMRQPLYLMMMAVVAIVTIGCTSKGPQSRRDIPEETVFGHADSLVIETGLTGDFERTIAIADSLVRTGELSQIRADNYRGIAYINLGEMQKSLECFRRASSDDNPPAADFWEYINAGSGLARLQNAQHNLDGAIRTAIHFIDQLRSVECPRRARELHNLYFCLGNTQTKLERQDEAAESFNEAYHWLKICVDNDSTGKEMIDALTTLENIAIAQLNLQQIDEAEKWVNREDSLLSIFKKSNVADSVEVDFYQALTMLNRARICQERGQEAEAARYYDEYMTSNYGKSAEGRISSCSYLMAARRYTEAAYNFNFLNDFMEGRALEFDLETINDELMPKLRSNYYAGRKDSALQVAMQIAEVYDSALIRQKRSDAAELATIYDTQGKERQIAEQRAGKRLFTTISIATGLVALLILAFAVYVYRQWRATQEKNRILAQQITEAVEYKEKLREEKKKQVAFEEEAVKAGLSISDFTTLTDEQLFLCLRDLIENEQLFLQPDFGRQTLIDRTGLSKECIGAAFAQGSDTNSLPAYVRELRLDYAVRLMNAQPDITIEQVSQASGFTSADTFTRNFRAKFGMTPTAYKQTKISE